MQMKGMKEMMFRVSSDPMRPPTSWGVKWKSRFRVEQQTDLKVLHLVTMMTGLVHSVIQSRIHVFILVSFPYICNQIYAKVSDSMSVFPLTSAAC